MDLQNTEMVNVVYVGPDGVNFPRFFARHGQVYQLTPGELQYNQLNSNPPDFEEVTQADVAILEAEETEAPKKRGRKAKD